MNVKICAIVLIIILGVSTIGGLLILSTNDDDVDEVVYTNRLMVYGNANSDDYLDERDVKSIQGIIDNQKDGNSWDRAKYPFADADCDGDVDEDDLAFVKRMVAREAMEIHILDADGKVVDIDYPVGNVAAVTTATFDPLTILGVQDKAVARHGQKFAFDQIRHSYYESLPAVGKTVTGVGCVDVAMFSNVASKIPGGIDAVITTSGWVPEDVEKILRDSGTTVVRLGFGSINTEPAAILNLGYLMGAEERSHEYMKFVDEVEAVVDDAVSKVPLEKRPVVVCTGGGGNGIMCNQTADCEWSIKAGAINNITPEVLGSDFAKYIREGDTWQYGKAFDSDYLLYSNGIKFDQGVDQFVEGIHKMDKFLGQHDAYPQNVVAISSQIPSIVGALYYAQFFYPDQFTENLADGYLQTFIDDFLELDGYLVSEHPFFYTYEDLRDKL